jgi:hypothetical protein
MDRSAGWVMVIILIAWLLILIGITGTATYRFGRLSKRFGLAKGLWQTCNRPGACIWAVLAQPHHLGDGHRLAVFLFE